MLHVPPSNEYHVNKLLIEELIRLKSYIGSTKWIQLAHYN